MAYIGISSRDVPDHPEWHPRFLYDAIDERAVADIRRRIAVGAKRVVVEVVEEPDATWIWVKEGATFCLPGRKEKIG